MNADIQFDGLLRDRKRRNANDQSGAIRANCSYTVEMFRPALEVRTRRDRQAVRVSAFAQRVRGLVSKCALGWWLWHPNQSAMVWWQ